MQDKLLKLIPLDPRGRVMFDFEKDDSRDELELLEAEDKDKERSEHGEDLRAPADIIEEYVRINPNTGKVDLRQPFRSVRVALLCGDGEGGDDDPGGKDWRLVQSTRIERYEQHGPGFHLRPLKTRLAFFLALGGFSPAHCRWP